MLPGRSLSIWLFVGISLLVNGLLIVGAGVYEIVYPPEHPVVLFNVHANLWWGGLLVLVGALYCYYFSARRRTR